MIELALLLAILVAALVSPLWVIWLIKRWDRVGVAEAARRRSAANRQRVAAS